MIHTYLMALCLAVAEHEQHYFHHHINYLSAAWYWSNMNQQPMHENIECGSFRNNQKMYTTFCEINL